MPTTTNSDRSRKWREGNPEKYRDGQRRYRENNKAKRAETQRRCDLRREYGITPEQYDALLERQGGACAMCGSAASSGKGRLHVDHCHDKGHVRGLLCHGCNTGIGLLKHDVSLLGKAITYLKAEPCSLN